MTRTTAIAALLAAAPLPATAQDARHPVPAPRVVAGAATNGIIDKAAVLERSTFLDNRDVDWYERNVPFLETPDKAFDDTYYYRFDMMTKHFVYGSPATGYTVTEFIDRPGWSGTYGAISAALGLQFSDLRWLRDRRVARDYARYWFHTPGAQPRAYSDWFGASMWGLYEAWGDRAFVVGMLPDMKAQYAGWEAEHWDPKAGMFAWNGMQDGMETNINSRQTDDWFRGAEGFRPTLNSYLYGDALAIAKTATLAGDPATAATFAGKAAALKKQVQDRLWDPKRQFFFHMFAHDEKDGIKAGSLTYQTGRYAGNEHGRELIGFVPWQFNLPDPGHEAAWKTLMDPDYFYAPYGPRTVEVHDPLYRTGDRCCQWSGDSWPYATAQTLEAMANLLNNYPKAPVTREDYVRLLRNFSLEQRLDGKPFVAEAMNADTGKWQIVPGHSEHYFHSSYPDLVITGLAGLRPRADGVLEVNPLFPEAWPYFALDDIPYHGHLVSILWDRDGLHYRKGTGLTLIVDGKVAAHSPTLGKLEVPIAPPPATMTDGGRGEPINFAVNNDGAFFPNVRASFSDPATPPQVLTDGAYWYLKQPANRWTTQGSPHATDTIELNLGASRLVETLKLYFLDDGQGVRPPLDYTVEYRDGAAWRTVTDATRRPAVPAGHMPDIVAFARPIASERFRVTLTHRPGAAVGMTEIEAWGHAALPLSAPTAKIDDLAYNPGGRRFPKASASYTSPFDRIEQVNDGKVFFTSNSQNRWTAFESPHASDWVQIDMGKPQTVGRVELYIWGDNDGVKAPRRYDIQYWGHGRWHPATVRSATPQTPKASTLNTAIIEPVRTDKIRVVFTHAAPKRSGLTEIMLWQK